MSFVTAFRPWKAIASARVEERRSDILDIPLENNVLHRGFDPFNDRPSRTVRNTLSEMLRDCLGHRELFSEVRADLLQRYPQPPYADYIRDRVDRYRVATSEALSAGDSPVSPWRPSCGVTDYILKPTKCWSLTGRRLRGKSGRG